MNLGPEVQAFNGYYNDGMKEYEQGNLESAKNLLLKAAEIANDLSAKSKTGSMKVEYYQLATKTLKFVQEKCCKDNRIKKVVDGGSDKSEKEEVSEIFAEDTKDKITFDDVAGLSEVKEEVIYKVITPYKNPTIAEKYKIKTGGKILLYGPPGTGKTLIARAIAGEVDAKFYSVNCQDLISKYLGESSQKLDNLFETALRNERAIIFFDEIDSIATKRENDHGGADGEMARFVATFLTKIDGFKKSKSNKMLLLLAATNRPWAIDKAMLRGGRFDTQIYVTLPDFEARLFMVKKEMMGVPMDASVDLNEIANRLDGYGGGDIVSICDKVKNLGYRRAIKNNKEEKITIQDFAKIIAKQKNVITEEELLKFENYNKQ